MRSLQESIAAYEECLEEIPKEIEDQKPDSLIRVLLVRDALARRLSNEQAVSAQVLLRVVALDQKLKDMAPRIVECAGPTTIRNWREGVKPSPSAWWWYLDDRAAATVKLNPLWTVVGGLFLALSITFTSDIATRFLRTGPDFYGVFSTIVQAVLTLLAGGALAGLGQHMLEDKFSNTRIRRFLQPAGRTVIAFTLLLAVMILRFSLPSVAHSYHEHGRELQKAGQIMSAIKQYQLALSLAPDYANAHYNLATAYEDVVNYDEAISEYRLAIKNDGTFYQAYNNLARMYILRLKDPSSALELINIAMQEPKESTQDVHDELYSLYKNRGWANLELKNYSLAETDLKRALALRPTGGAAYCLLAQVRETQSGGQDATTDWESCLRYSGPTEFVESQWRALAQERLTRKESK